MMGALVGAGFGGVLGAYQAVQMRSFLVMPISMIVSGGSFGFFMGLGMTIRTQGMWALYAQEFCAAKLNGWSMILTKRFVIN